MNENESCNLEIDIDQLLLHSRDLFLYGGIDMIKAEKICKELLGLSQLNDKPIGIWINSYGGCVEAGFSIINTIFGLSCPVYTFINGNASSMAALISIAGEKRVMMNYSSWMIHDGSANWGDEYTKKIEERLVQYYIPQWKRMKQYIKSRTFLTDQELEKSRIGELRIWPDKAKEKGIVDEVIKGSWKTRRKK